MYSREFIRRCSKKKYKLPSEYKKGMFGFSYARKKNMAVKTPPINLQKSPGQFFQKKINFVLLIFYKFDPKTLKCILGILYIYMTLFVFLTSENPHIPFSKVW